MTDSTNNFNDNPRECLEHYATRRPDSIMGYRLYIENELTRHFVALGALEWRAIDGVKYCKTTSDGRRMLEEYRHAETQAQLDAAHKRIAELEAVCREVVEAFEIQVKDDFYQHGNIEIVTGPDEYDFEYYANNGNPFHTALRRLLDTLPPSE